MQPHLDVASFVAKWRSATLSENAAAQSHFNDLCYLLDHPTPVDADPRGAFFTFQKGATKTTGSKGWADVWKKGYFAWEYKGKHKNLAKAYQQLLQYREALENPKLLVVCDMNRFEVHTNFTNSIKRVYAFSLSDLLSPATIATTYLLSPLTVLRHTFTAPDLLEPKISPAQATVKAAARFAELARRLRARQEEPTTVARFLMQLLFCLFAEDTDLLPSDLFTNLVKGFRGRPDWFCHQLAELFRAMEHGRPFGLHGIRHFNGRLFEDARVLPLTADDIAILEEAAKDDWGSIEPSIFGTLFERSLDPANRTEVGEHYTSRADIEAIIQPVLMDPLVREWTHVKEMLEAHRTVLILGEPIYDSVAQHEARKHVEEALSAYIARLASQRILDPACGSGNFLYVALKRLLDLWNEVRTYALNLGIDTLQPHLLSPHQLYGIERNTYAHQLASLAVWIGYLQWLRDNGYPQEQDPVLQPLDTIECKDAVLAFDAVDRPREPTWPSVDVIVGNPPFLGGNKLRQELGSRYVDALFSLYEGRVPAFSDYVCYWFEHARGQVETGNAARVGLLATNSIRGGVNRQVLERIKLTGDIFMAWGDRPWVLDGAAVRVSMIGFDDGSETSRLLDDKPVTTINADLTGQADLTRAQPLRENGGICFMGPSPKAPFDIPEWQARVMLEAARNINGHPNSDVVRRVLSGVDLVQRDRGLWTIDFGSRSLEEAAAYELPFAYVKQHVYPVRSQNRRLAYAAKWWQYAEVRPGLRRALQGHSRCIATPSLAKHRVFVWVPIDVLCNQQTLIFARDDDYFFGVLHSAVHEMWALAQGTSLEDRPRYTSTTTFETFPFPWPPGGEQQDAPQVQAITTAARDLVDKRDRWLNPPDASEAELKKRTLTNLYNQRPTWLQLLHERLDHAVLTAYGWPTDLSDEAILERLLRLNRRRAARVMTQDTIQMALGDEPEQEPDETSSEAMSDAG